MMPPGINRIRWWWWIGIIWVGGYIALFAPAATRVSMRRWIVGHPLPTLLPLLAGLAWLVVVAPMLESRVARFTDRWTGRRRALMIRIFARIPTVVFILLLVQVIIVRIFGIEDFGWYDHGYGWWVAGATILSIFYARLMSRALTTRVHAATREAGVCFHCNYRLTNLTSDRCPECGAPIA